MTARKTFLALMKLGFAPEDIACMPCGEAIEYLEAFSSIVNPQKPGKTYKVRRKGKGPNRS